MRYLVALLFMAAPFSAFAQFGVNVHQSNLPFIGLNYEIKSKIRPELRVGIDNYIEETTLEGIVTYDIIEKEDYEFYAGIGGRINNLAGLVIPIGLNVFPLASKQLGVHIELAPIVKESNVLRGSWGIRYQFGRGGTR